MRTLSRVHVSQRYSIPRAPDCTVHVTGTSSTLVPHHEHAVRCWPCFPTRSVSQRIKELAGTGHAGDTREVTGSVYADEAHARWGRTEAFRQSQRRAAAYGPADWEEIKRQTSALEARLAAAMTEGWPAGSAIAMDLAQDHRDLLSRWFYDCSTDLHRALGSMYVDDPRFTEHYDQRAPGLASYLCAAIHANAERSDDDVV